MPIQVLVVDDSAFFRRRIKEILEKNPDIRVCGFAENGRDAVDKALALKPDVITMDYEMPLMDGISAVRAIMAKQPTPILMFSSLSFEGARVTLDALDAGALDYLPKSFESMSGDPGESARILQDKVLAITRRGRIMPRPVPAVAAAAPAAKPVTPAPVSPLPAAPRVAARPQPAASAPPATARKSTVLDSLNGERPRLILIGASTGGPVALQNILQQLPANFPFPILLVQHMPGTFTTAFAERLDRLCKIRVKEAEDNDPVRPGWALLAPGGKQMLLDARGQAVSVVEGNDKIQYRPSVDVTFGSAARSVKGKILAAVLTGMGHDGREGCKMLKRGGATIWTQNEQSCVVYGMPMAVETAGLSDAVVDLKDFGKYLSELR
ncbi:MAG: chemotaxis response regulator protein-glutamate methylesterase [Gammaproteobacteria bacterium]|nr:chemotaxis response regulator protein-glutamate methylesterase [Gammaproteobacteria bacterium]